MQIHYSEALEYSDSKKKVLSDLIAKRIALLIGERKAAQINNIYFLEDIPCAEKKSVKLQSLQKGMMTKELDGKIEIYFHSTVLTKLLHQGSGYILFDSSIVDISNDIPVN